MMQVGDQVQFNRSTFLTVQFIDGDAVTCAWLENHAPKTIVLNRQSLTPVQPMDPEEQRDPFDPFE
ncbi:hypothetical protein HBI98_06395 [Aeromonas veronii]|nr:hypothetical protein [Aeromonas veronii]